MYVLSLYIINQGDLAGSWLNAHELHNAGHAGHTCASDLQYFAYACPCAIHTRLYCSALRMRDHSEEVGQVY